MTMSTAQHFSTIQSTRASRFFTGIADLDWQFGCNDGEQQWGIPRGTSSLWAGSAGVGKTRLCMAMTKMLLNQGLTVVYFTLEITPGQFRTKYCKDMPADARLFISDANSLDAMTAIIEQHQPDFVVVDSVNSLPAYRNGLGATDIENAVRAVISRTGSHVAFISHLNATGSVKGGTYLPHMVDIVFTITPYGAIHTTDGQKVKDQMKGFVRVSAPNKHRFGKTGTVTRWKHMDYGVICDSTNRWADDDYRAAHPKPTDHIQFSTVEDKFDPELFNQMQYARRDKMDQQAFKQGNVDPEDYQLNGTYWLIGIPLMVVGFIGLYFLSGGIAGKGLGKLVFGLAIVVPALFAIGWMKNNKVKFITNRRRKKDPDWQPEQLWWVGRILKFISVFVAFGIFALLAMYFHPESVPWKHTVCIAMIPGCTLMAVGQIMQNKAQ